VTDFAFEAVETTDETVKAVFERGKGKIPGAGVVDLVTAEGFFEFSKAVPGVFGVFAGGDTPEVEGGSTAILSVEDNLDEEDDPGVEFTLHIAGGGVGVKAGSSIIVDEGGGERLVLEFGDVKGGKTGFELVFKVSFGLRLEMVFGTDGLEEGSKDGNFCGIFGLANF